MAVPIYKVAAKQNDKLIRLSNYGRENDKGITLNSTATDAGNSVTTILRKGLVVGKLSTGKYMQASNASVVNNAAATITGTGLQNFNFTGGLTLTLDVDGQIETLTSMDASGVTAASAVVAFNSAALAVNLRCSFSVANTSALAVTHLEEGSDHYLDFTSSGGTANASLSFSTDPSYGTDGAFGILLDGVDMKYPDLSAVVDQFGNIGTTGLWDESELLSMTVDAKRALMRLGAQFR